MSRYRLIHRQTGETWEIETTSAEEACKVVGWSESICEVTFLQNGPFIEIKPPKIAAQVSPPKPGSSHICPNCDVSLIEARDLGELWWRCPSCDLLYQEWENSFYRDDEI